MKRKLIIGLAAGGALLCLCGLVMEVFGPRERPPPKPVATSTVAIVPTSTPRPKPVLPSPTPTVRRPPPTPTPISKLNAADVIYVMGWQDRLQPSMALVIEHLQDISTAASVGDVVWMCSRVDRFYDASLNCLVELDALPSPNHPYLINAHNLIRKAVERWGIGAIAIQNFCDTGDIEEVEIATQAFDEATEMIADATEWLTQYQDEIK